MITTQMGGQPCMITAEAWGNPGYRWAEAATVRGLCAVAPCGSWLVSPRIWAGEFVDGLANLWILTGEVGTGIAPGCGSNPVLTSPSGRPQVRTRRQTCGDHARLPAVSRDHARLPGGGLGDA